MIFLRDVVSPKLAPHEKNSPSARSRETGTVVDGLRLLFPNATFVLFGNSFAAGVTCNEEDAQKLEQHFASNPGTGRMQRTGEEDRTEPLSCVR